MKQPPTNICPLLAIAGIGSFDSPAVCIAERCAWWNHPGCVMFGIAEQLTGIAASLEAMEPKKAAPSVSSTESGRAEQNLTGTVTASDDTRETEEMQA